MFSNFDFDLLNSPVFKEDSVREALIMPILNKLGYSHSTPEAQIVGEKQLVNPFYKVGSKKAKINHYPDYLLQTNDLSICVLDAKSPVQKLEDDGQVYGYAIHPEIRAKYFAMCNGREFVLWEKESSQSLLRFDLQEIDYYWEKLEKYLSPKNFLKPQHQISENIIPKSDFDYLNRPLLKEIVVKKRATRRHFGVHGYFTKQSWDVVQMHIKHFTQPGDLVLDPFVGSGVTTIESLILGRKTIGIDLNPLPVFIINNLCEPTDIAKLHEEFLKIKTKFENETDKIKKNTQEYLEKYKTEWQNLKNIKLDKTADVRTVVELFSKEQIAELAFLKHLIKKVKNQSIQKSLLLAFSSLITKQNLTYHNSKVGGGDAAAFRYYRYRIAKEPNKWDCWKAFGIKVKKIISAKQEIAPFINQKTIHNLQVYKGDATDLTKIPLFSKVVANRRFDGVFINSQRNNISILNEFQAKLDLASFIKKELDVINKLFPKLELPKNPKLKEKAKELRQGGNLSEVLFWNKVKNKQFLELDFSRQFIIGNYIVDFYCSKLNLVIEIDGESHNFKGEYDEQRENYLKDLDLNVIHFEDIRIKKDLDNVMQELYGWINKIIKNTPSGFCQPPLLEKGELSFVKNNSLEKGEFSLVENDSLKKGELENIPNFLKLSEDKKYIEIPNESVDYIYTDPPYGAKIAYLDLSAMWNAWLDLPVTEEDFEKEVIEGGSRNKSKNSYSDLIAKSIEEMYRVLKFDRWMSFVFAHKDPHYWHIIVETAEKVGFEYAGAVKQANGQTSFKKRQNPFTVIAGQLIINFKKVRSPKNILKANLGIDIAALVLETIEGIIAKNHGATLEEINDALVIQGLELGFLDILSKEYSDLTPILKNNFDYDFKTQKYFIKENKKFRTHIPLELRIKYYLISFLKRKEREQNLPTFDEICWEIIPLLKNGITPDNQDILNILETLAERTEDDRWKIKKEGQQELFK